MSPWVDPVLVILVGLCALLLGWRKIFRRRNPRARKVDLVITQHLTEVVSLRCANHGIHFHALRHNNANNYHWIDLHLLFPPQTPAVEAHRIAGEIEVTLIGSLSNRAHIVTYLES